ncbi:MAG: alpha/beta fold hydrolase [bacterium]|nr:alpha/beta fold hydrolase [bacterium]
MNTPSPVSENTPSVRSTAPALGALTSSGVALAHLTLIGATGLTRLIASTHATIASHPLPWKGEQVAAPEKAPLPYQLVTRSLLWLAALSQRFLGSLPADQQAGGLFRSVVNGVVGNALVDHGNPLNHGMTLRNEFGEELTPAQWAGDARRGIVLFLHGVCLSEREWQNFSHQGFVRELRELGYGVAWLRYNSGRAIAENGADLSALLEQLEGKTPVTLIGHSMGGLVIRAACHHAAQEKSAWLSRLQNAAYIGTPHQGAPLERLGESANRLLALTPYTRPLMQLGNIRSTGIQDLRHGRVTPAGQEHSLQLPEHARHLLIAAHMGRGERRHWMGDGLVPVRSALGQHLDTGKVLQGGDITRVEFSAMGHMAMLSDERIYAALLEWLKP